MCDTGDPVAFWKAKESYIYLSGSDGDTIRIAGLNPRVVSTESRVGHGTGAWIARAGVSPNSSSEKLPGPAQLQVSVV